MATLIVAGYAIRYPMGGMLLHSLHYAAGLRRLGHEVLFVETSGWPRSCYDPLRDEMTDDPAAGIRIVRRACKRMGIEDRWAYLDSDGRWHGRPWPQVKAALASAAALINISGVNWIEEFARIPIRVLVDTDPGRTQFRGEGRPRDHNLHFTFGLNIGAPDCGVPSPGVNWRPTLQPIALDLWRPGSGAGASFRTIMNWRSEPNIAWGGEVYGEKAESIASFIDLPSRTTAALELAVGAGATAEERRDFTRAGWTLVEANPISRGLGRYQRYLRGARGEWSVSKEIHTRARTGWFGDRSPCFLALGKPCVLQDTGFSRHLPVGEGLLAFRDLEEAVDALDRVEADYDRHARAARRLAEEHFDSDRVLGAILGAAGIGVRAR